MALPPFAVTWDYRCPFARNAHEHLVTALEDGAPWDVTFSPFSLSQVHVAEEDPPVWDQEAFAADLFPLRVGVAIRDRFAPSFLAAHRALFAARHDQGGNLRDRDVLAQAIGSVGLDPTEVLAEADEPWTLDEVRKAHEWSVDSHEVFGVPTFIAGERAAFARVMTRPGTDAVAARETIERVVGLVHGHPELNEIKHTSVGH